MPAPLRALALAAAAAALLLLPAQSLAAAPPRLKVLPGFIVEIDSAKPEAADELERSATVAQAMFEQFRNGKHSFHGLEDYLDLSEPPRAGEKGDKADRKKAKAAAGREVAIGFAQVDREGRKALASVGLKLSWLRLRTVRVLDSSLADRLAASFLLAQAFGGPLKDLPVAQGLQKGVPATLLASLDRISPGTFVAAWRLRDHLQPIADGQEALDKEGASSEELKRAPLVAKVWSIIFHDWTFQKDLFDSLWKLGNAPMGGLLELMAHACPQSRFAEMAALAAGSLRGKDFEQSMGWLKEYRARAFDFPTPETMLLAVGDGDAARVQRLLKAGADPSARSPDGDPVLVTAIDQEKADVARLLAEAGADPTVAGHEGRSALELAVWKKQPELVKALAARADLRVKGRGAGERATVEALKDGDLASLQGLLDAGANADVRDADRTPGLALAAQSEKLPVVEALAKAGAPLENADKEGQTALMIAAERGRLDIVKALLARGADAWAKNKRGKLAADLAEANNYPEIVAELKKQPPRR
jgi:hypothetical protein